MKPKFAILFLLFLLLAIVFGMIYLMRSASPIDKNQPAKNQSTLPAPKKTTPEDLLESMEATEAANPTQPKTEKERQEQVNEVLEAMKAAEAANPTQPKTEEEKQAEVNSMLDRMKAAETGN